MNLRIGRVVATHPEDHSVDLVMIDDGARIAGVQVMAGAATGNSGSHDLPAPGSAGGDKWDVTTPTDRDMIAVVATINRQAVVMGFLYPQISQMLFKEQDRRVTRHASDVYSTVDAHGNTEFYHPSGTYLRVGTSPAHEDLTGKDADGLWKIAKNTDKAVHVRLRVASAGAEVASLTIDPSGNVTLEHLGNFKAHAGGTMELESAGNMTLRAPRIDLNP